MCCRNLTTTIQKRKTKEKLRQYIVKKACKKNLMTSIY